ncbi:uncharacterized protein LOC123311409 [Coccinella septempunctata]|uniref:uncharacterized protein LOC123311409 n=1 Tax=Coccinella septempunctata TaxID=41139 RepID=UPI001D080C9D|nr:uncharacterized protein LOC123311409 [Coccinella septempunctata]XP_044751263.1 uncharacterized protein LOC123311409 [Coccinella septempunctata]
MADDSLPVDQPMKYHPTDSPRGTLYYNLEELTENQQIQLNALKINTIREDEKYLATHPEVRAIIVLLLRVLLRRRPMIKVHEFIAKFFNRSESDIADDVQEYLDSRKDHVYEDRSAVEISVNRKIMKGEREEIVPDRPLDYICAEDCVCDHAMEWKLPFEAHDNMSFTETEHWLTPKSSKTSMTLDDSHHGGTTDEYFSLTDLAKVIGAEEGDYGEEGMEAGDGRHVVQNEDDDEAEFFMGLSSSEVIKKETSDNPVGDDN